MHFNVYIDDDTGKRLEQIVRTSGKSRNRIIREAIEQWIRAKTARDWPEAVMSFEGATDFAPFEDHRGDLKPPREDPL